MSVAVCSGAWLGLMLAVLGVGRRLRIHHESLERRLGQRSRVSAERLRPSLKLRPYASCMELEVRPASEVGRFVAFGRANGCECRVLFRDNQLRFDVPLARDPTEARRIALDVIARFSAENTRADVRVTRYD